VGGGFRGGGNLAAGKLSGHFFFGSPGVTKTSTHVPVSPVFEPVPVFAEWAQPPRAIFPIS